MSRHISNQLRQKGKLVGSHHWERPTRAAYSGNQGLEAVSHPCIWLLLRTDCRLYYLLWQTGFHQKAASSSLTHALVLPLESKSYSSLGHNWKTLKERLTGQVCICAPSLCLQQKRGSFGRQGTITDQRVSSSPKVAELSSKGEEKDAGKFNNKCPFLKIEERCFSHMALPLAHLQQNHKLLPQNFLVSALGPCI